MSEFFTVIDDMLIEMITPKVKEIKEKFGNGEGLTQDDINTLLFKGAEPHHFKLQAISCALHQVESFFAKFISPFFLNKCGKERLDPPIFCY